MSAAQLSVTTWHDGDTWRSRVTGHRPPGGEWTPTSKESPSSQQPKKEPRP